MVPRPITARVYRFARLLRSNVTLGDIIAADCFRRPWRRDCEFATHTLVRAGISNFRWHDLRHTWASWHIQQGTPLNVLQELGGWSDPKMVRRYAHWSVEHLVSYADTLSGPEISTKLAQQEENGERVTLR
jgi:integrase